MEVGDGGASTCVHSWVSWRRVGEGRVGGDVRRGGGEGGAGTCVHGWVSWGRGRREGRVGGDVCRGGGEGGAGTCS